MRSIGVLWFLILGSAWAVPPTDEPTAALLDRLTRTGDIGMPRPQTDR